MRLQLKIIRKKFLKIIISMIIVISLGVALLFGLMNGVLSLQKSVDKFIEENNYPDIKITTKVEDIDKISSLSKEKFKNIEYRLSINTIINKDNNILSVKANTYEDKDIKDFFIYEEKENNSDYYNILVEKGFADNNNIKLGNIIKLKIDDEFYNFFVSKIISIPEAIVRVPINGMWGEINDYGNVYINRKVFEEETNKNKRKLLDEVQKKEKEILDEESNKEEEYKNAKSNISELLNGYISQENYYKGIKNNLNTKKVELNNNKQKLIELKNEYIGTTDTINNLKNTIYSYMNSYDNLSDDAKEYINKVIENKYPNIKIEDLEFITDIVYSILERNINEVFDSDSEINKKIKNKIMIADCGKQMLEEEYLYYNSDEVVSIINRIKNGEDVTESNEYLELKKSLETYKIFDEINDNNVILVYETKKAILDEIHKINSTLPFDSFSDLYNFIDSSRVLLPLVYNSYKNDLIPYYEKIIQINNSIKNSIKSEVDIIYNSNKLGIEKAKLITSKVFDYIQKIVDDSVLSVLSEYTDDLTGGPVPVIDRLINGTANGTANRIEENIKIIDDKLKKAYELINNNNIAVDEAYATFKDEISKAKQELNDKKIEIENIKGYENKFNEILICLYNTNDKEEILENILNNDLKDIEVIDSYTYEKSPIYNYINVNIESMKSLSTIVPIAFYIIVLVVLYLFISLMMKQSKKEIAILKLLGKTNNEIRLGFCISSLIVAILGVTLGMLLGFFPMIYMVQYFKNLFLLPSVVYTIDSFSIVLSIVSTIIVAGFATLFATLELNKIAPVELLKKEEYQNKEISKFAKFVTSKFKPFRKFSILVYIRNKSKLILGIICTSATVAIIFSSLAYVASKDRIFYNYFDERIHYDAQIFKSGTITDEEIEELRNLYYVENANLLRYFNVTLKNNNKEINTVINALDNKNHYISIFDKDNNEIEYPENGIVLEEHIANKLGLEVNDEITINGVQFKIVNISFQSLGRVNYISLADSYKLKPSFEAIVLNMDNDKQNALINRVSNDDNYIYTVFKDKLKQYNKEIFDSYAIPSIIIIIFALIIGYIIVININTYNLLDQKKNLSIFRSLGFGYSEISQNWFIQSLIQWIISIIIGIPCGVLLSKIFLKTVSSSNREFIYASGIKEIVITMILLFIYIYIGHKKCMRNFKKMNIIEEVKDKE